jgi:uncharacterized membrane protein
MEVVAGCPRNPSPHVDYWRFETLHALRSPYTRTGLANLFIVNIEVPQGSTSFLASTTLIPLDKLDPEQRRAQKKELREQKGMLRPIGIGSCLVRFANHALLAVNNDELSQWLAARHQFQVGVRGGLKSVQFIR